MDKFQNKYRIVSHRLVGWDYSSNGYYFITLNIENRETVLGKIEDNKMVLSDFGKIVNEELLKSLEIRNELFLDEFVVMPNHLHALILLNHPNGTVDRDSNAETHDPDSNVTETHGTPKLLFQIPSVRGTIKIYN